MNPLRAFLTTFALSLVVLSAGHSLASAPAQPDVQIGPIPAGVAIA
jgi:hypothetical protein